MDEFFVLRQQLPGIQKNVRLQKYTTFRIGGPARYFFVAKTSEDIARAAETARMLAMRFFLLSGGSNILFSDNGFPGLVIKVQNANYQIHNPCVWAQAGVKISTLVKETGKLGLEGLEWAGGLPGTVGGAIRGNAGAFGGEMKDCIESVEALDEKGMRRILSKKQCHFGYRSSIFKEKNFIVLAATLKFHEGNKKEIQAVARDHIRYRKERHPLDFPNAGSIFKNCDVQKVSKRIQSEFRGVIKQDPFPVIPTAAVIAAAKLQGLRVGDAQVSEKHPNYIVNLGNARASDVVKLIARVKKEIKKKFAIDLEEEVQLVS